VTTSETCLPVTDSVEESSGIRREELLDLDALDGLDVAVEKGSAREKDEVSVIL
jgi:hypothetical protein